MTDHLLSHLPAGTYICDCVLLSKPEAPCVASIACDRETGHGTRELTFCIPVPTSTALEEIHKIVPQDKLVGNTKVRASTNKDADGCIPNGTCQLFDIALIEQDRILVVVARYWTQADTVEEARFYLQYAPEKVGKRFMEAANQWFQKAGSIEEFLSARAYLDAEVSRQIDHTVQCPSFGTAMALACLEKNLFNRALNIAYLDRYISDLKNGKWGRPSDAICFSNCSHLIEGGHRSIATVISGCEGYQSLSFNFHKDAMKNFNKGAMRNEAGNHDIKQRMQAVEGVSEGELDFTKLSKGKDFTKVIRNMILIHTDTNSKNNRAYLDAFTAEYYNQFAWYNSVEAASKASFIRKDNGIIGACFVLAHRKAPAIVEDIFEKVTAASGLVPGTALHTLHSVLANEAAENSKGNLSLGLAQKILICLHRHIEHVESGGPAEYVLGVKGRKLDGHKKQAKAFFTYEVTDVSGRTHRTFLPETDPDIEVSKSAAE